ncbi:MAG: MATE family efflux transporter [Clostridia bacterium]
MSETIIKENKMGTAKMLPLIISMGLPSMFSMMVQALYNIVDSYFVSSYSTDALSGVSLAFPIQNLLIAFAVGTAVGVGSLVSRKLGEGDKKIAGNAATHGIFLSLITWVPFLIFGLMGSEMFIKLFETDATIVALGTEYLTIVSTCSIFCFVQICLEKVLQSTGNMVLPMLMQLTGAVVNIILDPILIFGYFGLPEMGVAGAAIATIIGQFCGFMIAVIGVFFSKKGHEIDIHFKGFKFDKKIVKMIYIVGFPSIIMNAVGTIMLAGMNLILASFSSAAYTVFSLYFKLQSFVFMPVFGLTNGLMPILGYNFGARNKERIISCLKIGCSIALSINVVGMIVFMIFPAELLGIFGPTEEILEIGIVALRIISIIFPMSAISITGATLFQAVGKGNYSLINSFLRQIVVILPSAYFLSKISLDVLWYSFPIAEAVALVITAFLFIKFYKEKIKTM